MAEPGGSERPPAPSGEELAALLQDAKRAYAAWREARANERRARAAFVIELRHAATLMTRSALARELGLSITRVKQILERG